MLGKSSCHEQYFSQEKGEILEKKVDGGDFQKVEHGYLLRAVLLPCPWSALLTQMVLHSTHSSQNWQMSIKLKQ